MKITLFQTADDTLYSKILDHTALAVRAYAARVGAGYDSFVGLKRGGSPWHAAFNRVYMLEDLARPDATGWAIYLDSDAWIDDLSFDLRQYLSDKGDRAALLSPAGDACEWWNINDGVFMINLDQPLARDLIRDWKHAVDENWHRIETCTSFPLGGPDDQTLLHEVLRAGYKSDAFHFMDRSLINTRNARFIRHYLRGPKRTFEDRVNFIAEAVREALDRNGPARAD